MLNVKRLRVLRVEMGISQYAAADLISMPRHRFQLIEQGLVQPSVDETAALEALAKRLSKSLFGQQTDPSGESQRE